MKVFISWSGNRSKAVAEILRDWIKCVLQATRPWISTRDIDRGSLWFSEINDQLKDTSVGIVCLTRENRNRPWILFEAGALAKGLSSNRVCTLLVDLRPADLEDPLAQFNHTSPERESMWSLVQTLNNCLGSNGLDEQILAQVFSTYWKQFEIRFKETLKNNATTGKVEPRSEKTLLAEILENTRTLNQRLRKIESSKMAPVQIDEDWASVHLPSAVPGISVVSNGEAHFFPEHLSTAQASEITPRSNLVLRRRSKKKASVKAKPAAPES